jgi:hypothetical protein
MDIDLLISKTQDVGIVTNGKFESAVTAAILDHETYMLSLEFGKTMDSMDMNIPVSHDFVPYLTNTSHLFVIGTDRAHIHEAYRIPLMHVNDYNSNNIGEWK